MVLPYNPHPRDRPVTKNELRKNGTMVAVEMMGRWFWIAQSEKTGTTRYLREFSPEEIEQASKLKTCEHRLDLSGRLRIRTFDDEP